MRHSDKTNWMGMVFNRDKRANYSTPLNCPAKDTQSSRPSGSLDPDDMNPDGYFEDEPRTDQDKFSYYIELRRSHRG